LTSVTFRKVGHNLSGSIDLEAELDSETCKGTLTILRGVAGGGAPFRELLPILRVTIPCPMPRRVPPLWTVQH